MEEAKKLSFDFSNLFHDKSTSDFEISIKNDDKETFGKDSHFSVHLCIIIQRWKSFRDQHLKKSTKEEIIEKTKKMKNKKKTFKNLNSSIVQKILFFLYTNDLTIFKNISIDDLNYHLDILKLKEEYLKSANVRESIVSEKFFLQDFCSQFVQETDELNDSMIIKIVMYTLCDFTVESENWKISCHRSILKHRSDYFKIFFSESFKQENSLILDEMEEKIVFELIKYFYTSEINLSIENCVGITFCSNLFSTKEIEQKSTKFLKNSLNIDIVFDALNLLEHLDTSNTIELKEECFKFLLQHSEGNEIKFKEFLQKIQNPKHKEEISKIQKIIKKQQELKKGIKYFPSFKKK